MVKFLLLFIMYAFALTNAAAQITCSTRNIHGLWKKCGAIRSETYDHPPAGINADSLREALHGYNNTDVTWHFNADGTYLYEMHSAGIKDKGHFSIDENGCMLKLSTRKKLYIVYIDDSCMILWHNNPKTAYLTEYHR